MNIYSAEKSIAELIEKNTSISYCVLAEPIEYDEKFFTLSNISDVDPVPSTKDLFFFRSILVSSVVNKNDDCFLAEEIWKSKSSPSHKPLNLGHDSSKIIGHILSTIPIDKDHNIVDSSLAIDEIPEFIHLVNSHVLYKFYHNSEEREEEVSKAISDIEAGKLYTSMECYFTSFDYCAFSDNEFHLIPRNSETAFLTKHLRAYSGEGIYNGMKLGRVLRNTTFAGNSLVENPANINSIIFSPKDLAISNIQKENQNFLINTNIDKTTGVYKCMNPNLENVMDKQVSDLEVKLQKSEALIKELQEEISQADIQKHISKAEDLETKLSEALQSLKTADEAKACMCNQLEDVKKEKEALQAEKETLQTKLSEIKIEATRKSRIEAFTKKNFSDADAIAKEEELRSLDDDTFAKVVNLIDDRKPVTVESDQVKSELETDEQEETAAISTVEKDDKIETVAQVTGGNTESDEDELTYESAIAAYYANILVKENK